MNRKAVDVVLMPDEAMIARAIEANARLVEQFGARLVLDRDKCRPHISLAMGSIDSDAVGIAERILKGIARTCALGLLKVTGIVVSTDSIGEKVSVFEVEMTERLRRLHEAVMNEFEAYLSSNVSRDMVYDGHDVDESSLLWMRSYREKSSFEHFFPHITIGYGQLDDAGFPIEFGVSKLAICHLGNHCTCRAVLAAVDVEGA